MSNCHSKDIKGRLKITNDKRIYSFYRAGNENYRIFQNQQQLQRQSSISTLSYDNPVYETNEYQMHENPQNDTK